MRLEQRINPRAMVARLGALERANAVLRERKAAGLYRPAGWIVRVPKDISAMGHARLAELRADPE